jgi:hypothetical protein
MSRCINTHNVLIVTKLKKKNVNEATTTQADVRTTCPAPRDSF